MHDGTGILSDVWETEAFLYLACVDLQTFSHCRRGNGAAIIYKKVNLFMLEQVRQNQKKSLTQHNISLFNGWNADNLPIDSLFIENYMQTLI